MQPVSLIPAPAAAPSEPAPPAAAGRSRPQTLWLALHLPPWPLQAAAKLLDTLASPADAARVVVDGQGRERRVHACNAAAGRLGITAGMPVSAAHALGSFDVVPRSAAAEHALLERLALRLYAFSPIISLAPPDGLLLELAGSVKLFGGPGALLAQLREAVDEETPGADLAVAPTPLAALAFARSGCPGTLARDRLRQRLDQIPLASLRLPDKAMQALGKIGVATVGECLRLPRDGLARRFGHELPVSLDKLRGLRPDPRPRFALPDRFHGHVALPWEIRALPRLDDAMLRLLRQLMNYLRARCRSALCLDWTLHCMNRQTLALSLPLTSPEHDAARLQTLMRERLRRVTLPDAVHAITLKVDAFAAQQSGDGDLFARLPGMDPAADADRHDDALRQFLNRVQARLGQRALRQLARRVDHRPEQSWRWQAVRDLSRRHAMPPARAGAVARPLWLLESPLPLEMHGCRPCYDGPLTLISERERIECGWWAGGQARDYYVASNAQHARLWIFREFGKAPGWYLHGFFG